jgi:PAS domain S-box-containing protein
MADSDEMPGIRVPLDQRVLVLAPYSGDSSVICDALSRAQISAIACADMAELCRRVEQGAAAALIVEEALTEESRRRLRMVLSRQPDWSELPILVLVAVQREWDDALVDLQSVGGASHVGLLERPMRPAALVSSVQISVRARRHQYRIRDELKNRARIEEALRESAERLSMAQRAGRIGVFDWELTEGRMVWSQELEQILGIPAGPFDSSYTVWADRVHPRDLEMIEELLAEWLRSNKPDSSWEYRYARADGEQRWMATRARLLRDTGGKPARMIGTNMDVTERKRTEEALLSLNETLEERVAERTAEVERRARDLRRLAVELSDTEQRERQRLAEVLHEGLQQSLVAAKLRVEALVRRAGPAQRESVDQIIDLLVTCLDITRGLTTELSPPVLQYGGLLEVIEWLGKWSSDRYEMRIEIDADEDLPSVPKSTISFLFRSVGELIFNAKKHGHATLVRVELKHSAGTVLISVEDDGSNFDPGAVEEKMLTPRGLGLFSIRERLEAIDGRLDVSTGHEGGARFRMYLPVTGMAFPVVRETQHIAVAGTRDLQEPEGADEGGTIRLLVADDHQVVRQGLISLLNRQADLRAIGEAADGSEAVEQVDILNPDVALIDAEMPVMDGVEATRRVRERHPDMIIIGISAHDEGYVRREMLEAGADTFMSKDSPAEDLIATIRTAVRRHRHGNRR